jgi:hypothetical protein
MSSDWWYARLEHKPKARAEPPEYQDDILPLFADALDDMARANGLRPLTGFFFDEAAIEDELFREHLTDKFGPGFGPGDLDEETYEALPAGPRELRDRHGPFFDPAEGLATVRGLLAHIAGNPGVITALRRGFTNDTPFVDEAVTSKLGELEAVLKYALKNKRRFRIGLPEFEP